jgi:hypothetical protein
MSRTYAAGRPSSLIPPWIFLDLYPDSTSSESTTFCNGSGVVIHLDKNSLKTLIRRTSQQRAKALLSGELAPEFKY